MTTKSELLQLLEANRDGTVSGQDAAKRLGVSRAAVWKAVQALRDDGITVEAQPGAGYRLAAGSDVLSAEAVGVWLERQVPLRVLEAVDSTNLEAKRWAIEGAPHGALVAARRQTAGRGRLGRSFTSPPGGLYLSVVLRPPPHLAGGAVMTTTLAAVAVCRAVTRLCGLELGIKWVNDLYLGGKKCCGILTEAGTDIESGSIEYLVLGIGLNLTTPASAFEPEVAKVATALFPGGTMPVPTAQLAAAIHGQVMALFDALPDKAFLNEYRQHSLALGRTVTVLANPPWQGLAEAIDEDAHLVVRRPDGTAATLSYGEISIKL